MAWFDVLANVGDSLGQTAQTLQERLLLERERQDRLKREEEERRRFQLGEERAAAAERRASEQFALTKQQQLDQDVERVLQTFEGETIPEDVVQWAGRTSPKVAKALLQKGEGGFTRRLSSAEREAAEQRRFTQRERQVKEKQLATQERLLAAPDVKALSVPERMQLAKLNGLDENALLTPAEITERAKASPGYLAAVTQARIYAENAGKVTEREMRLRNEQGLKQYEKDVAELGKKETLFNQLLNKALDAKMRVFQAGTGFGAFNKAYGTDPAERDRVALEVKNQVLSAMGLPPTTDPALFGWGLPRPNRDDYLPFPELAPKPSAKISIDSKNPLGGYGGPAAKGTTMQLPDGTVVTVR
jgi:hypothetical protein